MLTLPGQNARPSDITPTNQTPNSINLNLTTTAMRCRDETFRNGPKRPSKWTFFPFTSSDLENPGNPTFNRLYQLAYIRFNVTEKRRIKVRMYPRWRRCQPSRSSRVCRPGGTSGHGEAGAGLKTAPTVGISRERRGDYRRSPGLFRDTARNLL